jgi:transcriptional regulator with XRE-family HTH domain
VPSSPDPLLQRRRLSFGAVVRARRMSLGLTQGQLAVRAGCDRQSIVRIETAAHAPSLDRVFTLADALDIGIDTLFREFDRVDHG